MWIGIDDTDGPDGGCTTYTLTEVVRVAGELGVDLLGYPRLVRLNPNIPWKTRGNGALAARFGHGRGAPRSIGSLPNGPLRAYRRGRAIAPGLAKQLVDAAWERVLATSSHAPRTDPVLVASPRAPSVELYERAVRSVVPIADARRALEAVGGTFRARGGSRGLVGAAAAIAWAGPRRTFELLAYRTAGRTGPRAVEPASIEEAERRVPTLFQCRDPSTRRLLVSPHTPCPILFGLRSTRSTGLVTALGLVRSEPIDRWAVFVSNQGTGDHVIDRAIGSIGPYEAARLIGRVVTPPVRLRGGHVRFGIGDVGASIDCLAFEPTKVLPNVAARLRVGDRVRVWGGRGRDPVLRLEGIELLAPVARRSSATRPPECPTCRRTSSSMGRARGYRCPGCHRRFPPEAARSVAAPVALAPGTYHPTPSARRHLHPVVRRDDHGTGGRSARARSALERP